MKTALIGALTLVATAAAPLLCGAESTNRCYELRIYYAAPDKLDALHARFRDHTLGLFAKHGIVNVGYWVPIENPERKLVYLIEHASMEAREATWKAFGSDPAWQKVVKESEASGKLVDKAEVTVLRATDYSPVPKVSVAEPRVFEMRTYTAAPGKLANLNARFRDHTLALFRKHGMVNFAYFTPAEGQPGADQTLVYFLAHASLEAAQKSFAAFRADPAWVAVRKTSEDQAGGSLTAPDGVKSVFMKPTDYSPTR